MPDPLTVCVYCASSQAVAPHYREVAAATGAAIAARGWRLVYGGGDVGLMGVLARAALAAGGHVTGVIPHRLADREIALDTVSELIRVDTMRERKALMDERSDAFLVLPGGIGTLEELVEMLTLKQLGYHGRPVVLLDDHGYWDPLIAMLERMVEQDFAADSLLELFTAASTVAEAITALALPPAAVRPRPADPEDILEAVEGPPRGAGA